MADAFLLLTLCVLADGTSPTVRGVHTGYIFALIFRPVALRSAVVFGRTMVVLSALDWFALPLFVAHLGNKMMGKLKYTIS